MPRVSRRALCRAALSLPLASGLVPGVRAAPTHPARVVALDLAAMDIASFAGARLIGAAAASQYRAGRADMTLPSDIIDVGTVAEPNLELLQELAPDLLVTAWPALPTASLQKIAPVVALRLFADAPDRYAACLQCVRTTAGRVGTDNVASQALQAAAIALQSAAGRLSDRRGQCVCLVNSNIDGINLRVFGRSSLLGSVLPRLGMANAWEGSEGIWGWELINPERLSAIPDALLVDVTQYWDGAALARRRLTGSPIWKRLPQVQAGRVLTLPPVAVLGGPSSALRFASLLTDALAQAPG